MNDDNEYVAPPSEGHIKRMSKIILLSIGNFFKYIGIAFKTPYRGLTTGQKILKLIIQLVIAAVVIYIAYIIISAIIGIIIAIVGLLLLGLFSGNDDVYIDKRGNRYRRF